MPMHVPISHVNNRHMAWRRNKGPKAASGDAVCALEDITSHSIVQPTNCVIIQQHPTNLPPTDQRGTWKQWIFSRCHHPRLSHPPQRNSSHLWWSDKRAKNSEIMLSSLLQQLAQTETEVVTSMQVGSTVLQQSLLATIESWVCQHHVSA